MIEKGIKIEVEIKKIVFGGEGMGHYDGKVIFVPESIPGDILEIKIISSKKNYSRGLIEKIIKPSKYRINPICSFFNECGACDFMMIDYNMQLTYKKDMVKEVINSIAGIEDFEIHNTIASPQIYAYRNKIIQAFGKENGKVISGFYKKKTHDIIDNDNCNIQTEISNKILKKMKEKLTQNSISIYDEETKKGMLRNVMIRCSKNEEIMLVAVSNTEKIKKIEEVVLDICSEFENIKSAYISINTTGSNVVLGKKNIHIYGEKVIYENINSLRFMVSPLSFFQINTLQAEIMYDIALNYFENLENKIIVDAYSGTGTIGSIFSKKAKYVYCIESVREACEDAKENLKINNIENVSIINGKVEEKLIELLETGFKIDGIVFDPPRKGLEKIIIDKVNEVNIKEIVYISCNASSFARDAKLFKDYGYKLLKVQPVDMFPNTNHVEIIAKFMK